MKMELRSEFADKSVYQGTRKDLDELRERLRNYERGGTQVPTTGDSEGRAEKSIEELRKEFLAFRASLFEQEKEDSVDASADASQRSPDEQKEGESKREGGEDTSKPEDQAKAGTTINLPKKGYMGMTSIIETQKALRQLSKRVKEVDDKLSEMKTNSEVNDNLLKELQERVELLTQSVDKKAAALDMKAMLASISELNARNNALKSSVVTIEETLKTFASVDETKVLKGKVSSLESKLTFALRSMKEFQKKFSDLATFQPISATEAPEDDENKEEERINRFMDETNKKIEELKILIEKQSNDFTRLSGSVNEQMNSKASIENLIELENKIYKELDKVLYTLGKKIASIDCRKEVSNIQIRVKRLYEFYLSSVTHLKDHTEDASLIKRSLEGVSCISCDKDVSNVYELLNQSHDYVAWNRLPQRDTSLLHPKVTFS